MPHELVMDLKGLEYEDLSESIQKSIDEFATIFDRVLEDGYVDDQEEQELLTKSYAIAKAIESEHGSVSQGDTTTGVVVGVLVGIGATIGLSQLFKS
ncbi:MAG: hypothetical protein A3D31_11370 [Candidatus Fluviicola riflensis]|nr:MAG: hypothetical protein CHH17_15795 [Candidatus Fluviicola riflensis]OGS77589.1 MAG: hypothetical protein A3D31_11370 [Candidatus Fluviicola riflensis]OGS84171.1 MAG: hypothetical protein A3E30_12775 [Fluviicola sp. RIFCSPHIGHO2_12_FULL_43_24]OGS84655.1 MAG: hypothetical protein A2724_08305 [Fluviicola sp. RIFCSPHIGHO2_01_FULL_43_53]